MEYTVDFTSDGTPVGVAAGNLWLVRLATFILQPMEHTNHKFPVATATGVPSEVKSTVPDIQWSRLVQWNRHPQSCITLDAGIKCLPAYKRCLLLSAHFLAAIRHFL